MSVVTYTGRIPAGFLHGRARTNQTFSALNFQAVRTEVSQCDLFSSPPALSGQPRRPVWNGVKDVVINSSRMLAELCSLDLLIKEKRQSLSAVAHCFQTPAGFSRGKLNIA